jgi:hypothetical protein
MKCTDCHYMPSNPDKDRCARTGKQITEFVMSLEWGCTGFEARSEAIVCPRCGGEVHEYFCADNVRRWRCFGCDRRYSAAGGWQIKGGELIRVWGETWCAIK